MGIATDTAVQLAGSGHLQTNYTVQSTAALSFACGSHQSHGPKGRASRDEVIVSSSLVQLKKFIFASGSSSTRGQCGLCGGGGGTLRLHVARVALTTPRGYQAWVTLIASESRALPVRCILSSVS